jgi:hypothetical protein
MSTHPNLLGEPAPTLLPVDEAPARLVSSGAPAVDVAARYPAFSLAWAMLADEAIAAGRPVESYAYARTGYHRGLDALRRSGWKGHGPIPWSHVANQGFLRSLAALAKAAEAIGEDPEADRCWTFLAESSAEAYTALHDS